MVTATAIAATDKPVQVLTSDTDDIEMLLGERLDRSNAQRGADNLKVKVLPAGGQGVAGSNPVVPTC
jgi:hypothetical protein